MSVSRLRLLTLSETGHKPSHCALISALNKGSDSDWFDHCGEFDAPASKARGASRVCVSSRISETGHKPSHCAPTSALKEVV